MRNQKEYDAHDTAKDGEITFTLQAGDPYAPVMAELWAALMADNSALLAPAFSAISNAHSREIASGNWFGRIQREKGKDTKARATAQGMREQAASIDAPKPDEFHHLRPYLCKYGYRLHDTESGVVCAVDQDGKGGEIANTHNGFGDQDGNAQLIVFALNKMLEK